MALRAIRSTRALYITAIILTAASLSVAILNYAGAWGDLRASYPKTGLLITTALFWLLWSDTRKGRQIVDTVAEAAQEIRIEVVLSALEDHVTS